MMIAQVCDLQSGRIHPTFGDAHIYNNHIEQLQLQLIARVLPLPTMKLNPKIKNIFRFQV